MNQNQREKGLKASLFANCFQRLLRVLRMIVLSLLTLLFLVSCGLFSSMSSGQSYIEMKNQPDDQSASPPQPQVEAPACSESLLTPELECFDGSRLIRSLKSVAGESLETGIHQLSPNTFLEGIIEISADAFADFSCDLLSGRSSHADLVKESGIKIEGSPPHCRLLIVPEKDQEGKVTIWLNWRDKSDAPLASFEMEFKNTQVVSLFSVIREVESLEDEPLTVSFQVDESLADSSDRSCSRALRYLSDNTDLVAEQGAVVFSGLIPDCRASIMPVSDSSGLVVLTFSSKIRESAEFVSFEARVSPVNDAPTIDSIEDQVTLEDTPLLGLALRIADVDSELDCASLTGASSNSNLLPAENIVFGGEMPDCTVSLMPLPEQQGVTSVSMQVTDGSLSAIETFDLVVSPVNDAPTIAAISDQITDEDQSITIPVTLHDPDTDLQCDEMAIESSNQSLIDSNNLVISGAYPDCFLQLMPKANQHGSANMTLAISDGLEIARRTFKLFVNSVYDEPGEVVPWEWQSFRVITTGSEAVLDMALSSAVEQSEPQLRVGWSLLPSELESWSEDPDVSLQSGGTIDVSSCVENSETPGTLLKKTCGYDLSSHEPWERIYFLVVATTEPPPAVEEDAQLPPAEHRKTSQEVAARVPPGMVYHPREVWPSEFSEMAYDFALDQVEASLDDGSLFINDVGGVLRSEVGRSVAQAPSFGALSTGCLNRANLLGYGEFVGSAWFRRFRLPRLREYLVAASLQETTQGCVLGQSDGQLALAGTSPGCRTELGVLDLVGNQRETVDAYIDLSTLDVRYEPLHISVWVRLKELPSSGWIVDWDMSRFAPKRTTQSFPDEWPDVSEYMQGAYFSRASSGVRLFEFGGHATSQSPQSPFSLHLHADASGTNLGIGGRCAIAGPRKFAGGNETLMVHSKVDHGWRASLAVSGDLAFVSSYGGSTLEVYRRRDDDRDSLVRVQTIANAVSTVIRDIVASDSHVFVFGPAQVVVYPISSGTLGGSVRTLNLTSCESVFSAYLRNDKIAVVCNARVRLLSIADPANPIQVGSVEVSSGQRAYWSPSDILWIRRQSGSASSLHSFNVSNPSSPVPLGQLTNLDMSNSLVSTLVSNEGGHRAYLIPVSDSILAMGNSGSTGGWTYTRGGITFVDITDPSQPRLHAVIPRGASTVLVKYGDYLLGTSHYNNDNLYDISNPALPYHVAYNIPSPAGKEKQQGPTEAAVFDDGLVIWTQHEVSTGVITFRINPISD